MSKDSRERGESRDGEAANWRAGTRRLRRSYNQSTIERRLWNGGKWGAVTVQQKKHFWNATKKAPFQNPTWDELPVSPRSIFPRGNKWNFTSPIHLHAVWRHSGGRATQPSWEISLGSWKPYFYSGTNPEEKFLGMATIQKTSSSTFNLCPGSKKLYVHQPFLSRGLG